MPAKRPCASSAAAPAKPSAGAVSSGLVSAATPTLAATAEIAAPPPCACGSAMPTSVTLGPPRRRAEHADRREVSRAVDAQQRKLAAWSVATRSALPRPGSAMTLQPSISLPVGQDWPAAETNTPVPYSTLRRGASAAPATAKPGRTARRRSTSAPPAGPWCLPSPGRRGW